MDDLSSLFAPAQRTLPAMLQVQAERHGDRLLVALGDTRWSYRDALRVAATFGEKLRAAGITAGDRVALICSNRAEFVQTLLGCAWIGAVTVPVNVAARGVQLRHVLANSGARLLVSEPEGLAAVSQLEGDPLPLERVWLVGDASAATSD